MSDKEIITTNETPILKDVVKGAFGSSTSAGDTSGFGGLVTTIQAAPSAQRPCNVFVTFETEEGVSRA